MTEESETENDGQSLESLVATAVTSLTMITAFGLLAAGVDWFWVVFIVGFAGVLPLASVLAKRYDRRSESDQSGADDALATLRTRYASGEISEAEFERRVERLLETESGPEQDTASGSRTDPGTLSGPDPESESLSGLETEFESPADTDPGSLSDIDPASETSSDVGSKSESLSEVRSERGGEHGVEYEREEE
jgi:uncharacterized membrane protein